MSVGKRLLARFVALWSMLACLNGPDVALWAQASGTGSQTICSSDLSIRIDDKSATVRTHGELFATYDFKNYAKPILYPLKGPGGIDLTRNYPMQPSVAGESHDHEHHKSVWFAHGNVNGLDFWSEQARIANVRVDLVCGDSGWPGFVATNLWLNNDKPVLTERATFRFCDRGDVRFVDVDFQLTAETTVRFFDTKEGTFGIRTRPELQLAREDVSLLVAHAENSAGQTDRNIWGQPADWVSYFGKVDGRDFGFAFFDHPANFRHPTTWHAREYGLVAANPFGLHDFLKQPEGSGDLDLPARKSLELHYRLAIFQEEFSRDKTIEWYREFTAQ